MENQHPDIDKPIQTLKCCCCGGYTKGRQFHNQDTGFGLGFCCLQFVQSRCEDVERTYGVLGIHYMDPSSAEPMKILDAFNLAATLHAGITDKAGRPYIEHLGRVFLRVIDAGGSRDQQVAALLHDAIEDGLITNEGLIQAGVPEIAIELINALTKKDGQSYWNTSQVSKVFLPPFWSSTATWRITLMKRGSPGCQRTKPAAFVRNIDKPSRY